MSDYHVLFGDGAAIGTGVLVNKSIPPYAIVVGNAATVIDYRFSSEIIEELFRIQWWNWDERKSIDSIGDLEGDVSEFVKNYVVRNTIVEQSQGSKAKLQAEA